jgi:hypothetical protein
VHSDICPPNDRTSLITNDALDGYASENAPSGNNCAVFDDTASQCGNSCSINIFGTSWANPGALPTGFNGSAPNFDLSGGLTTLDVDTFTLELFPAYIAVTVPSPYNSQNAQAIGARVPDKGL